MSYKKAVAQLRDADPVLAAIIARVGPCRLAQRRDGTHFDALVQSIVYQQLSGKAASTILGRFVALYGERGPQPADVAATDDAALRAVGLSRQKTSYLKDLGAKVASGALPLDHIDTLSDDEVIAHLVQVKGIGRWTAQMFLMFRLGRVDVLPELDLGIQTAIHRAYRMRRRTTPKDVQRRGAKWKPFRSIASWYLWRSLENGDGKL
jgi:DNA-3-methyladenine glycosylase II